MSLDRIGQSPDSRARAGSCTSAHSRSLSPAASSVRQRPDAPPDRPAAPPREPFQAVRDRRRRRANLHTSSAGAARGPARSMQQRAQRADCRSEAAVRVFTGRQVHVGTPRPPPRPGMPATGLAWDCRQADKGREDGATRSRSEETGLHRRSRAVLRWRAAAARPRYDALLEDARRDQARWASRSVWSATGTSRATFAAIDTSGVTGR